jgi:hypothetical protein
LLDLPHGFWTVIDEADWPAVEGLTVYRGNNGYAYFSKWENGKSMPRTLHGFLMNPPKGSHVDHINGNKLDNRRENLRVVTPQRNQVNRKRPNRNNTSGVRGVSWCRESLHNPWKAQITAGGQNYHLGLFPTIEEALEARRAAELEHFGEFCP